MSKSIDELVVLTSEYTERLKKLSDNGVTASEDGKWSANDQIIHLILSVAPLIKALKLPKLQLKLMFGTIKRKALTYDEIKANYTTALQKGGKAPSNFVPKDNKFNTNAELYDSWHEKTKNLQKELSKWKEDDLAKIALPHPLLGKLSINEMIHFTLIHTRHHLAKIKA